MDAELKAKWVEALRSGKYEQARSCLMARNGARCCLGVLCDVIAPGDPYVAGDYKLLDEHGMHSSVRNPLIHMNDAEGKSFAEIADEIEKTL